MYLAEYSIKKNKPNDLLVSWLKIVLALHPFDQNRGWSEGGTYPREGRKLEQGRLSKFEVLWWALNRAGALSRGNTVYISAICLQRGNGLKIPDAHPYPRLYRSAPPPRVFVNISRAGIWKVNSSFNTSSQSNPGDKSDLAKSMPDIIRVRFFSWEIVHSIQG